MNENIIVLVADEGYRNHAKSLIANIKIEGGWDGDICLITNMSDTSEFEDRGIIIKKLGTINPYYIKFDVFDTFFKKWKKVLYFDCDFIISKNLKTIFSLPENMMYCDAEKNTIKDLFIMWVGGYPHPVPLIDGEYQNKYIDKEKLSELDQEFNINKKCFNSSCMFFNTELINSETVNSLNMLKDKYKKINKHVGYVEGTDQPILNLLFINDWTQIPNNLVAFWRDKNEETVATHYCHWDAPWNTNNIIYLKNLKEFEKI